MPDEGQAAHSAAELHREADADHRKHERQRRPKHDLRRARRQGGADHDAGQRAGQQGTQQPPVDVAQIPVAQPSRQRERHRMGNVGPDDDRHLARG